MLYEVITEPLHQIWVATRANGFHFAYEEGVWIDNREGNELMTLVITSYSIHYTKLYEQLRS